MVLEFGEVLVIAADQAKSGWYCHGCQLGFLDGQKAVWQVDRLGRRAYLIHLTCQDQLIHRIEGSAHVGSNLPA